MNCIGGYLETFFTPENAVWLLHMDSPAWGRVDISWCECVVATQVSVLSSCTIFECRQLVSNWTVTKIIYKLIILITLLIMLLFEAVSAASGFIFIHENRKTHISCGHYVYFYFFLQMNIYTRYLHLDMFGFPPPPPFFSFLFFNIT